MERQSFKITFYLRRNRVTKAGLAPILSRVTVNGIAAEIPVKCHIYPERWNQQKERATGKDKLSVEINAALDIFRARALEIRTQIQQEGREVSVQEIKRRLTQATATRMFLQEFGNYCDVRQKEVGIQITQLTANKFKRVHRYLTEYTRTEYKKEDLPLPFIDHEYVYGFKIFIQTRYKCGNNGAVNLLKALRNFLLYCQRNEWLEKNPMRDLKLKVETNGIRAHLSKSELERHDRKRDAQRSAVAGSRRFRFLLPDRSCLQRRRQFENRTYRQRRCRQYVDTQTPSKDLGHERYSASALCTSHIGTLFRRFRMHGTRETATRLFQPADEQLSERTGRNMPYRQITDDSLRPTYIRLCRP